MKFFAAVIISFVIAGSSFTANAKGPGKSYKQLDDIDELLMLVCKEKRQGPGKCEKDKKGKNHGKYSKFGKGEKSRKCDMRGKYGKGEKGRKCGKYGSKSRRMGHSFRKKAGKYMLKAILREKYSKEMAEIIALKKSNDKAMKGVLAKFEVLLDKARAEMKAKMLKMKAGHEEFKKMLEEYKKNKDPKLAEKIKAKMSEFYDKRLEFMGKKLDNKTVQIQKSYDKLKAKKANKDKDILEKFEKITK